MLGEKHYKAAIIGPTSEVAGLRALGLDVLDATNAEEALAHMRTIKHGEDHDYAIVLILEGIAAKIPSLDYAKLSSRELPAYVIVPGRRGSSGASERRIQELSLRALGTNIL